MKQDRWFPRLRRLPLRVHRCERRLSVETPWQRSAVDLAVVFDLSKPFSPAMKESAGKLSKVLADHNKNGRYQDALDRLAPAIRDAHERRKPTVG